MTWFFIVKMEYGSDDKYIGMFKSKNTATDFLNNYYSDRLAYNYDQDIYEADDLVFRIESVSRKL